jgi:hypothetical protein
MPKNYFDRDAVETLVAFERESTFGQAARPLCQFSCRSTGAGFEEYLAFGGQANIPKLDPLPVGTEESTIQVVGRQRFSMILL